LKGAGHWSDSSRCKSSYTYTGATKMWNV